MEPIQTIAVHAYCVLRISRSGVQINFHLILNHHFAPRLINNVVSWRCLLRSSHVAFLWARIPPKFPRRLTVVPKLQSLSCKIVTSCASTSFQRKSCVLSATQGGHRTLAFSTASWQGRIPKPPCREPPLFV